jgi:hypothetical protein
MISAVAFSNGVQIATANENLAIVPLVHFNQASLDSTAQTLNSTGVAQTSFASGATIKISFSLELQSISGYLLSGPVVWAITLLQGTTVYNIVNVPTSISTIFPTLITYSQLIPVDYTVGTWTAIIQVFHSDGVTPLGVTTLTFTVT